MDRLDSSAIVVQGLEVRIVQSCTSTNALLLQERIGAQPVLLAAEEQTAGRGRRGRRWLSAPGAGITFSLACRVSRPARELAALSIVAGVAIAGALRTMGVHQAALKWPNDLVAAGAKLGGILVETRGRGSSAQAVIGIGINCRCDPALARRLRRVVASLDQFIEVGSRNRIIARTAAALLAALAAFDAGGLDAVRGEWEAMDAHAGQKLRVRLADGRVVTGVAGGLAEDGGLRLLTRRGVRAVHSGRVVRATPA